MTILQNVYLLEAQNVPIDWTCWLMFIPAVVAVTRWFIEYGDLSSLDIVYTLIQETTQEVLNRINTIQAFISNGFVHTSLPLDITRTYAYLTEYIRGLNRLLSIFGILINTLEQLCLPQRRAEILYIALHEAITEITDLHNQLGDQLNLVSIQAS